MKKLSLLTLALTALLATQTASATVVFTNFGPSLAFDYTQGNTIGNDFSGDNLASGATFTPLSTNYTFNSLTIALSCFFAPCADPFIVALTQDSAGQPATVIESFSVGGGTLSTSGSAYSPIVITSISHPTLSAGTAYWVTVATSTNNVGSWDLNNTGDVSSVALSYDAGVNWSAGGNPGAYQIDGAAIIAAPEPGSLIGLATGLLAMISARKFKRS